MSHKIKLWVRVVSGCFLSLLLGATSAMARLGTFNSNDGYQLFITPPGGTYNWADVSYYNAGAYGVNAGGGPGPTFIAPNSGPWKILSQAGGFFATAANRNAATSSAPPYSLTTPPNSAPAYVVGGHFPGHNNDNANLAIRNDNPPGTGPVVYDYYMDQYDMGTNPASVTSGIVSTQFYFLPSQGVATTALHAADKFNLGFLDSSGNIGVEWGYAMNNEVYWRTNTSGPWNYTGIFSAEQNPAGNPQWDAVNIAINLTSDTFQFDYYTAATNTWATVVPAGTALGVPMGDLTRLRWQEEDDDHSYFAGKNYFDDFTFARGSVPEPSGTLLTCVAGFAFGAARPRRVRCA
jgi:hypothetical protein